MRDIRMKQETFDAPTINRYRLPCSRNLMTVQAKRSSQDRGGGEKSGRLRSPLRTPRQPGGDLYRRLKSLEHLGPQTRTRNPAVSRCFLELGRRLFSMNSFEILHLIKKIKRLFNSVVAILSSRK